MDSKNAKEVIINIIKIINPHYDGTIIDKTPLFEVGVIDSLGVINLVLAIEEEFKVKILNDELITQNFDNVDSIYKLISSKL